MDMDMETQEGLVKEFPRLFRKGMFFECGSGWMNLLRDLCQALEDICRQQESAGEDYVMVAVQIKSKFGGLRFYVDSDTEEAYSLIQAVEARSLNICEVCGERGELRDSHGWLQTLCEAHGKGQDHV